MASLVFVHGIAVRAPTDGSEHPYDATCRAIGYELFLKNLDWQLFKCRWGDDLGAQLLGNGASFPPDREGRLGVASAPDDPAGLWGILLDDPTFELRALAGIPDIEAAKDAPGKGRPRWLELQTRLASSIQPGEGLKPHLARLDLEAVFPLAVKQVRDDLATQAAIKHSQAARAIARAIVARTVRIALERGIPAPTLPDLDTLVIETERLLQDGQLGGISDWAKSVLLGWGTSRAERRRAVLSQVATPIAGDVILYQVHGDLLRKRIAKVVANAPEPVAILAHSLGGVAAVETLCEDAGTRARVKKLVTVGSQSGFFYEINALRTLPFETPLPDDFPKWLNFWDPRDFLSFLVQPVFAGGPERQDIRIESGLPFPASHSGYWRQPDTWRALKDFLGK
jgi:hypothetical protein